MLLLKLGEREHLEMLRRGLLYMNSLAFFKSLEADQTRRDRREGIDYIYQPGDCEFVLDPGIPGFEKIRASAASGLAGVQIRTRRTSSCNIFCMFAVTKPIEGSLFPKSHPWFGDSFLIFTQTQEFLSRVEAAANHQGLKGECRLVQYYDENNYTGEAGRFRKSSIFSYQSEYRIALETGTEGPFRFEIGDLCDITSDVLPLDLADHVLKLRPEDLGAAGLSWD
jgi:hypothetical protein